MNGRFLTQAITGVQRYAVEIVRALDHLIGTEDGRRAFPAARWTLLVPGPTSHDLSLRHIETRSIGHFIHPYAWDQTLLAAEARDGILISLSNRGPIAHRRHLVVIHDAIVFRHPEFYGRGYVWFHRTMGRLLSRTATIATVSDFSRRELADVLGLDPGTMPILPNGADHLARVVPDDTVLDEFDLRRRPFFFALGSISGNKNVGVAVKAFSRLGRPDARLVLVGGDGKIFRSVRNEAASGVIHAGRLPDERIASLYRHATAFVFPSIYEGFGIPPLEAMAFGSPVLASTAEAVREVCSDAAVYFRSDDVDGLSALLANRLAEGPFPPHRRQQQTSRASMFTWDASARRLIDVASSL